MDNNKTGRFIGKQRKELGYNQKDLAEKLNVTDKAVSKWETGRSSPDVSLLMPLAEILNVSVAEILSGEKISQEELPTASNEIIVKSIKKSKSKIVLAIILALIVIVGMLCIYPIYHYCSTIEDNYEMVQQQAEKIFQVDNLQYIGSAAKSDKKAFLFTDNIKSYVMLYEVDEFYDDRINCCISGASQCQFGVDYCCYGYNGETVFVMYNANLSNKMTEYDFVFREKKYICPVKDRYILDVFIDKDTTFTNPLLNMEKEII